MFSHVFVGRLKILAIASLAFAAPAGVFVSQQVAQAADGEAEELKNDEGVPQYVVKDGKVDKGTYNGYRRYSSACHVCHGPDGMGSTFAPALVDSLKNMDYWAFNDTVTNGRKNGASVMPSFGTDPNVMTHLEDIYRYLKARSDGKLERGRPERIKS
jgi:methanol metabolism-related c-type cytochrome